MILQKRLVRSYVRREGRMTKGQRQALLEHWSCYGLEVEQRKDAPFEKGGRRAKARRGDFKAIFQNENPVILEIGFGMGQSLLTLAEKYPEHNFVGVEVHRPGVGKLLSQLAEKNLKNVRIYQEDAVEILKKCIPDGSLQKILIFFPDPWPKKRHHKRRLIQSDFVELLAQKLKVGGKVFAATDWEDYAHHMLKVFSDSKYFKNQSEDNTFILRPDWRPVTKFEVRGQRLGHGVWEMGFEKIPPV